MGVRTRRDLVDEYRDDIVDLARRHGAYDVRLVGSVARGDETPVSDVDFVVRFEPGRSVFDQAGLIYDLTQLLGVEVDVVSAGGLRDDDPILDGARRL
jgi:uncharacterized protein